MIRRGILLVACMIAGYVLGNLVAHLVLIPVAAIKHLSNGLVNTLSAGGGVLGVLLGFGNWRRGAPPADSWGVHGSARWASQTEVRNALGGPNPSASRRGSRRCAEGPVLFRPRVRGPV